MAKTDKAEAAGAMDHRPTRALVFELEHVGFGGREIAYGAMKRVLAGRGMQLSPADFARCCLGSCVAESLPRLLAAAKKTRLSADKLAAEIADATRGAFAEAALKPDAGLASLLRSAASKGWASGAVSCLDDEARGRLAEILGGAKLRIVAMSAASADKPYPRADAWEGLARAMSILPGRCVALATSGDACKAALAAGMRCVAVPDRFTAFHDFSGADLVADRGLDDASARRILDLLEAR